MRLRLLLLIVMLGAATPATAEPLEFPWCANFADGAGANCGFISYEQCLKTGHVRPQPILPGTGRGRPTAADAPQAAASQKGLTV